MRITCGIILAAASAFGALAAIGGEVWISGGASEPEAPAPVLVKNFSLDSVPKKAILELAVAGWHELSVNGKRVGDEVLSPATCQPDLKISSVSHDVSPYLKIGTNTVEVLLGNGWYNCFTKVVWGFHDAPWKSAPMICGELVADGDKVLFATDGTWRAYDSPIVFNALRNGEWYDARKEGRRERERAATIVKYTPFGEVSPEDAAPCRALDPITPVRSFPARDGGTIYDFGSNRAGWCEIEVVGEAGAKVSIDYDECLTPTNTLLGDVCCFVRRAGDPRPAQHDEYILAGRADGEGWHPRFTYHGFRYAHVKTEGHVELKSIRSVFVHSDFAPVGTFAISDPVFAKLMDAARRSYLSNFVGIPTDCPHREKNGWTGDAQLAMETGLWNFDARSGYVHFLRMMLDSQRPNGAVPCILPWTDKFGFKWGSGPAWDAALFEIPWQIYRFYGDDAPAKEAYGAMKRYLSFIDGKARPDGLVEYGLGDWCAPKGAKVAPVLLTDSAYIYEFNRRVASWAERFGESAVAERCRARATAVKAAFNNKFYKGNGVYAGGELTSLAAPLYFKGLCADGEERKVAAELVRRVREQGYHASFGIQGAKWVPRALSEYGYIDDAWRIFTQPEAPGWAVWMKDNDTLLESFDDTAGGTPVSHNHIMFGDFSAWAFEYLAGIKIVKPGFAKANAEPHLPDGVESFDVSHKTLQGMIRVRAWREGGKAKYSVEGNLTDARTPETVVKVDISQKVGQVKPVNGVGQPPMLGGPTKFAMMHYLADAGIPYSRLHDVNGAHYVDIPKLFPNFDADENDPASYDFAFTDRLMLALETAGVEPFFRLGVTIENHCAIKAYCIHPPKDYAKWARIAEHVIRHYTEGWADGFRMKIEHWEIWNEPENYPDAMENQMWRGDWESYMRFYGVVSSHLKSKFPHLRIGGYGSCGFYAAVGANQVKAANSSPRMTYFVDCFTNFLVRAKSERWPFDFFSFHSYSLPDEARRQIVYARETLDAYGFRDTKMSFNEWLPGPSHDALGTARQAALVAAELIDLQNGPCDTAMIYDARCGVGDYSPLFNPLTYKPHKAYYAFMAFNELRKRGMAVKVTVFDGGKGAANGVRAVAAMGEDGSVAVMIANPSDTEAPFSLDMCNAISQQSLCCRITDNERTYAVVPMPSVLPPHSFIEVLSRVRGSDPRLPAGKHAARGCMASAVLKL